MADVFISYARADEEAARRAAQALRDYGFTVWFDEQLPAHRAYSEVIEEQLGAASAVLVLWSAHSIRSQWVRSEANRARERGVLVQARLDDCALPMPFDQQQCADLTGCARGRAASGWTIVADSIGELVGGGRIAVPARAGRPANPDRRALLGGIGAIGVAATGAMFLWRQQRSEELSPEAKLLLQKGLDALQSNDALDAEDPGSSLQAIALLTDATRAAPNSATAWGGLAMAYAVRRRVVPLAERPALEARSRSAAEKSLAIDPREARALAAQRLLVPVYRNWLDAERGDRQALERNPKLPILLFIMAGFLGEVGRYRDAVRYSRQYDRTKFLLPGADRKLIIDLWSAGDLAGADSLLEDAVRRWPQHPQIWRVRIAYLMFTGKAAEAAALLRESRDLPPEINADLVALMRVSSEALAGDRAPADAVRTNLEFVRSHPSFALRAGQMIAALGDLDSAFDLFEGYYFGRGEFAFAAPAGGDENRTTDRLFQPPMKGAWQDPRFTKLLERIGLTDYWRASGSVPDFRGAR